MPNTRNIQLLQTLTDQLSQTQAVYLIDYQGLTANDLNQLRAQLRQAGGQLLVVKNTLLLRALRQLPIGHSLVPSDQSLNEFQGNSAALLALEDEIQPLKVVIKYAAGKELPTIKLGLLNHRLLTADGVSQLAKLPGIDQLRAQVVGMLNQPISRLVFGLQGNLQKLVLVLDEVRKQKAN